MGPPNSYRGRFAPSPTGDLHLGCAATALVTWLAAREAGGRIVLRVEDLDTPRVVSNSLERQVEDLRWLGLDWDEGPGKGGAFAPYEQSKRQAGYEAAVADLARRGLVYYCDCSRAEIARVASAPHVGEEGPRYPGTCASFGMETRDWKRPPAIRLRVPDRVVTVVDRFQGEFSQNVSATVGDFVLRRGDGIFSYQLAVVVDDLAMEVGEVVRGADLLSSSPRQALLAELLGGAAPRFAHAPLVVSADGTRLAKRERGIAVRDHREAGVRGPEFVARLTHLLGLLPDAGAGSAVMPRELVGRGLLEHLRGRREVRTDSAFDLPEH